MNWPRHQTRRLSLALRMAISVAILSRRRSGYAIATSEEWSARPVAMNTDHLVRMLIAACQGYTCHHCDLSYLSDPAVFDHEAYPYCGGCGDHTPARWKP